MKAQKTGVREAFDRHAGVYDERFSSMRLAQEIRSDVWRIADTVFPPGSRLVDAGCGTGEDAVHFARNGCNVTAIDISPAMISKLKAKITEPEVATRIDFRVADIQQFVPDSLAYDGIFSNFGVLNCVPDLSWLRRTAERSLKPGGHLVLTTMGRFYPLESAVHMLKGEPRLAFRRFRRPAEAVIEGVRLDVFYHAPRTIRRALGPAFELKSIQGLRSLLPVPGLEHLERFGAFGLLRPLDRLICNFSPTASWADHFVTVWRLRQAVAKKLPSWIRRGAVRAFFSERRGGVPSIDAAKPPYGQSRSAPIQRSLRAVPYHPVCAFGAATPPKTGGELC